MYTLYAVGNATMLLNDFVGSLALGATCSQYERKRCFGLFHQVPLKYQTPILSVSESWLLGNATGVTLIIDICLTESP